jgi:hypothetical protein
MWPVTILRNAPLTSSLHAASCPVAPPSAVPSQFMMTPTIGRQSDSRKLNQYQMNGASAPSRWLFWSRNTEADQTPLVPQSP